MVDTLNVALSLLAASYETSEPIVTTTVVHNAESSKKSAATARKSIANKAAPISSTSSKSEATSILKNPAPGPKSDPLPEKGTIDAATFLASLSGCGKRLNDRGLMSYAGDIARREDEMKLIASFVGYDSRQLHGIQLENVRRQAKLVLKPVSAKEFKHGASPSIAGFVAGMPDNLQAQIANLQAREQLSAESLGKHLATASNAPSESERALANAMAQVEEARLNQIRLDLAALPGGLTQAV